MTPRTKLFVAGVVCLALATSTRAGETQIAFPTAEGFGAAAVGGRGGEVLFVTNLLDYDPANEKVIAGSLRAACSTQGPRTVIFHVSGTIPLKAPLVIQHPYLTLAGQTAPGGGVCVTRHGTGIGRTHDVIVRYMRFRPGDAVPRERAMRSEDTRFEVDALSVTGSQNVIIDHCSASWSTDETLSVGHTPLDNVTVQWCFITQALHDSFHGKGAHGYGGIDSRAANAKISRHHNLYAHNTTRSPKVGSVHDENLEKTEKEMGVKDQGLLYDFRNNVIYNWVSRAGYTSPSHDRFRMNYIGNSLRAGPNTRDEIAFASCPRAQIFQSGNRLNGENRGWSIVHGEYARAGTPFAVAPVATEEAQTAYQRVLAEGGACLPARDAIDRRVASEVERGGGSVIHSQKQVGGYAKYVVATRPQSYDQDADGMPDAWEREHGLSAGVQDNNGDVDGDGYTNLEEFLNGTDPT